MADEIPERTADTTAESPAPEATAAEPGARRFKFPTALTVLTIILLAVWVAAFIIPAGIYDVDPETGETIPGSYHELPSCGDVPETEVCVDDSLSGRFSILWTAPSYGLYGVENERGFVGDEEGFLYGSAMIFLFVLAVGAFITVTMKTGAIQAGIGALALRFRHSPALLVIVLMAIFALGGTSYGMWEETLGFFALLVPLALALNYDRMVGASIIFLGAGSGVLASTVNPFATGVASDAAGIGITEGIGLRIAMWLVLVPVAMAYVLWYGSRVRADPSRSLVGGGEAAIGGGPPAQEVEALEPLTGKHKVILVIFFVAFLTMIYGFVPWHDIWDTVFDADFPLPTFSNFFFPEASVLFLVAAVAIALIAGFGEQGTVDSILAGAADFLPAALVIVVARAVTVVMKNTYITDTILHWMEDAVSDTSETRFAALAFIVNMPIAFLVPSSSGHAALVMPILAPLADFADVPRSLAVTAYQSASGLVNLVTPTSAVVMGGLML
ncbi:MAG TPA: YfcC family protein, partial [Dehalococcoidia bacterium]|nr:YfcC family protein [Dehalococcoidia bacterium]